MNSRYSKEVMEAVHGDDAVLGYMEMYRKGFESGDRSGLMGLIFLCARYQAVIPDWAVVELLEIEKNLEQGSSKDFNEAFGWKPSNQATRRKEERLNYNNEQVLALIHELRRKGGKLNSDAIFSDVADQLGVSRRDVEAIYKASGKAAKDVSGDDRFAMRHNDILEYRRTGRGVLKD